MKDLKWRDYGESSLTLLAVYAGMDKARPSIPYDPSDFNRCVHLIKCLNLTLKQERELLQKAAVQYPIWKPFVDNWGELMRLFRGRTKKAPKLYERLTELRKIKTDK